MFTDTDKSVGLLRQKGGGVTRALHLTIQLGTDMHLYVYMWTMYKYLKRQKLEVTINIMVH